MTEAAEEALKFIQAQHLSTTELHWLRGRLDALIFLAGLAEARGRLHLRSAP